jgi:hypothetical protein
VYVIGHNYDSMERHCETVSTDTCVKYDRASPIGQDAALVRTEGQEVRLIIALQVRKVPAIEHTMST